MSEQITQRQNLKYLIALIPLFFVLLLQQFLLVSCGENTKDNQPPPGRADSLFYLNHSDSARYVGMNTCRQCHQSIYESFIRTGMGQSFDSATTGKSSARFTSSTIHDKFSDLSYHAFWRDSSRLMIYEFRKNGNDTVHRRLETVNYIIGSGQHTNSHLQNVNGYINQMPMTYYTQKKKWDLPPGFEEGMNTRFSRKIGLECMTCHNAYPEFVMGSENKFKSVPNGIDCERCHGPGSLHVEARMSSAPVDTSKYIDYTIVNPSKLPIDLQFDVCQRCHLQGNAVLKPGRSFFDFKPGQRLSDYMDVFLPKYTNAEDEFVMASHADRLKQSPCYVGSLKKSSGAMTLKPYKDALTCVTCHNPHVSVKETSIDHFNNTCRGCHPADNYDKPSLDELKRADCGLHPLGKSNCVSCHMPPSGSTDIPHVSVHDHFIRRPVTAAQKAKIRQFMGLFAINNADPDPYSKARAYIDQYEKFKQDKTFLDSADFYLRKSGESPMNAPERIQLAFIKKDYDGVIRIVSKAGEEKTLKEVFVSKSYDNRHAWAAYRVGESYLNKGNTDGALGWFERSCQLAPYNLDFRNKLGSLYASLNQITKAEEQFQFILSEQPNFVSAYANLGYIKMLQGFPQEALRLYNKGRSLDPDNETLLLNLAGYYLFVKDLVSARRFLGELTEKHPGNLQAQTILRQLKNS